MKSGVPPVSEKQHAFLSKRHQQENLYEAKEMETSGTERRGEGRSLRE